MQFLYNTTFLYNRLGETTYNEIITSLDFEIIELNPSCLTGKFLKLLHYVFGFSTEDLVKLSFAHQILGIMFKLRTKLDKMTFVKTDLIHV